VIFMAVVLAWAPTRRWVVGSLVVGAAVVLVVGVAVVCVRYHYVSDVVGGVLLGLLIATVPVRHLRRHGLDMGP
jgi:membrane-associated phospholipid phosphatase